MGIRFLGVAAACLTVVGLSPLAPSTAAAATGYKATLSAGQSLVNDQFYGPDATLVSSNGLFTLLVSGTSVSIEEHASPFNGSSGYSLWWYFASPGRYHLNDRSRLVMQRDGNLVLYASNGYVVWSSHTQGTGSSDRLVMQNDGNLVIYSGMRAVWASQTTPVILTAGHVLGSGAQWVNRYRQQFGITPTRLVMQRDGNLVVYWGSRATWSSRTFVPGSRLVQQTDGNLVIYSPLGRALWQSGTAGWGRATTLTVAQCGTIQLTDSLPDYRLKVFPNGASGSCG